MVIRILRKYRTCQVMPMTLLLVCTPKLSYSYLFSFNLGGLCKHIAGLILYVNTHRDEHCTDISCSFIEPSKLAKSQYPRGEEIEKIDNIPEDLKMPRLTFDMISDAEKEYHANLMLKAGNTRSPLFQIFSMRYQSQPPQPENFDNMLPDWVKNYVFQETNEKDIEFRVITFKFVTHLFFSLKFSKILLNQFNIFFSH